MPDIADVAWSERDDHNSEAVPAGWPQGAMPAYVDQTGRMMMGATKRFWNKINPVYQTSGTADAYVVQTEVGIDQINLYELLCARIDRSNAGSTPTLQWGNTNPRTIVKVGPSGFVPLAAGDMFAGNSHTFWYNGAFYVLTDPALIVGSTVQPYSPNLTTWAAITRAAGYDAFAATSSSANLAALVTDETGTGKLVFATGPTLSAPLLAGGTSGTTILQASATASGTLTLPAATDTLVGKATTDTLTNKTFDTAGAGNSLLINGVAATANTGTGAVVRATSPTLVTPALGTPTSGVLTNTTGLPLSTGVTGLLTLANLALGTSGYALIGNGASAPSYQGYTQAGTGSLTRTWQNRLQERISVLDFTGVDPTGSTDSRAGIVAADAAAAALGKALYFPSGNYLISAAITPSSFAFWQGESKAKVTLTTTSATADTLSVSNGSFTLDNISFGTNITRTGGSYINISASVVSITNFNMTGTFQGVFLSAAVSTIYVANGNISTATSSSIGIRLHGGVAVEFAYMIVVWNGVAHPFACLYIDNGGDYSFTNCQFLAGTNGGSINPAAGQSVAYCRFTNCWFDTSLGAGLTITPSSTGAVTGCDFVQCWFSTSGTHGVQIAPGASASVTNVNFANCFLINNGTAGFTMAGAVIADCNFINNTINGPGTTAGFSMSTGIVRARIQGNRIGGHTYGIFSDGTPTDAMIYDNLFVACTNKIAGAWLGATRIERNVGYNPVGAAAITPGASPYTYTAGSSPETVYTSATTSITAATQGGVSILPAALGANVPLCIDLGPNEAVVITYTGTLAARKMIH